MTELEKDKSKDEQFQHSTYLFVESLRCLMLDPDEQAESLGGLFGGVAWELASDIKRYGYEILDYHGDRLDEVQMNGIRSLIGDIRKLPPEALDGNDQVISEGLLHESWSALAVDAEKLLILLLPHVRYVYKEMSLDLEWLEK